MRIASLVVVMLSLSAAYAAGDSKTGKALYDRSCKNCHGVNGVASPQIVKMMKVEMKNLGSSDVQKMSDDELKKVITAGKGKMPAVKTVTGKSLDDVVAHIRTFKK